MHGGKQDNNIFHFFQEFRITVMKVQLDDGCPPNQPDLMAPLIIEYQILFLSRYPEW